MIESLPDALQEQVADHIRTYIAELEDKKRWDTSPFGYLLHPV
jgi:hypothetical protein